MRQRPILHQIDGAGADLDRSTRGIGFRRVHDEVCHRLLQSTGIDLDTTFSTGEREV